MKIKITTRDRNIFATARTDDGKFVAEAYGVYFSGDNQFSGRGIGAPVAATLRFERDGKWVEAERVSLGTALTRARHDRKFRAWFKAEGRAKLAALAAQIAGG